MNNISFNLINKINNENSKLVKQLVEFINDRKITSIEELNDYENKIFTIDSEVLNDQERIKYCLNMYENFPFEYEDLTFAECQIERQLYNKLKNNVGISQSKKILVLLFSLTGREIYFLKEAYEMIINDEI